MFRLQPRLLNIALQSRSFPAFNAARALSIRAGTWTIADNKSLNIATQADKVFVKEEIHQGKWILQEMQPQNEWYVCSDGDMRVKTEGEKLIRQIKRGDQWEEEVSSKAVTQPVEEIAPDVEVAG